MELRFEDETLGGEVGPSTVEKNEVRPGLTRTLVILVGL
jgi:hypothetical protein